MIECFIEASELEKALEWKNHLIERASYERAFLKLKKIKILL